MPSDNLVSFAVDKQDAELDRPTSDSQNMVQVTALLTVRNRRERTLQCLASLFSQETELDVRISAVVLDDGSSDATAEHVAKQFPQTRVLKGDGSLFWAGGMALAHAAAVVTHPDYVLWLNDDVELDLNALDTLLQISEGSVPSAIVVAALRGSSSDMLTYSGMVKRGPSPTQLRRVKPDAQPRRVDTFNGNVVLVPREIYQVLGPPEALYRHYYADLDYGYRSVAHGYANLLAPGYLGVCDNNGDIVPWRDVGVSRRERISRLFGTKGLPLRPHFRFVRNHGGLAWPAYVCIPYFKALMHIVVSPQTHNYRTSQK